MNYYIQGNKEKADQIKTAFGKYVSTQEMAEYDFSQEEYLFYTGQEERGTFVYAAWSDSVIANIIKTHPGYRELELPVEPNFNVGDWVVKKDGKTFYGGNYAVQITSIEVDEGSRHIWLSSTTWVRDNDIRLWSIADAKDGDVLATDNGWTCIFKAFDGYGFSSYCFMDSQKWFCEVGAEGHTLDSRINGNIHPATKEQRNMFFAKMKEAGYEWDADKKELKKIKHYDISNFHAGMPVLVRDYDNSRWSYVQFSHYVGECGMKFNACGIPYVQCIPFNEETKHLLGTTDMCDEMYINW